MNQKSLTMLSKWVLIVGGLSRGLQGLTNTDLVSSVFGSLGMLVNLVIGVAALYLAFVLLTKKPRK